MTNLFIAILVEINGKLLDNIRFFPKEPKWKHCMTIDLYAYCLAYGTIIMRGTFDCPKLYKDIHWSQSWTPWSCFFCWDFFLDLFQSLLSRIFNNNLVDDLVLLSNHMLSDFCFYFIVIFLAIGFPFSFFTFLSSLQKFLGQIVQLFFFVYRASEFFFFFTLLVSFLPRFTFGVSMC